MATRKHNVLATIARAALKKANQLGHFEEHRRNKGVLIYTQKQKVDIEKTIKLVFLIRVSNEFLFIELILIRIRSPFMDTLTRFYKLFLRCFFV